MERKGDWVARVAMGRWGQRPGTSQGPMRRAVRDATTAGPLMSNELLMAANPSVRVGQNQSLLLLSLAMVKVLRPR